jgi:hypothetical protein
MVFDPTTSEDHEVCRLVIFRDSRSLRNCSGGAAWNTGTSRNPENLMELILRSFQVLRTGENKPEGPRQQAKWASSKELLHRSGKDE